MRLAFSIPGRPALTRAGRVFGLCERPLGAVHRVRFAPHTARLSNLKLLSTDVLGCVFIRVKSLKPNKAMKDPLLPPLPFPVQFQADAPPPLDLSSSRTSSRQLRWQSVKTESENYVETLGSRFPSATFRA